MVFTPPPWVPTLPYEPSDTLPIHQFILNDTYRSIPLSGSLNPFTCGISGRTYPAVEEPQRLEFLARALANELGWHPNEGSEWEKVVGVFAFNTIDTITLAYATHRLNGIITPASAAYSASEVEYQLKAAGAKVLFTCISLLQTALKAAKAVGIPEKHVYILELPEEVTGNERCEHKTLNQLMEEGKKCPPIEDLIWKIGQGGRQTAYLCFSSGTSGLPKGVKISHRNVISNLLSLRTYEKPSRDKREEPRATILGLLPMSHVYGLVSAAHLSNLQGNSLIILPRFEMTSYLKAIQDHKIQALYLVPPIIVLMIKNVELCNKYDLSSVESVISGAAPLGKETAAEIEKCFPTWIIRQGYGLTETSPVVSSTTLQDAWHGSSGSLIPGYIAKIISPSGKEITQLNQSGELIVQSHSVVLGYLNNEKADRETFLEDADGRGRWMRTGDEAMIRMAPSGNEHLFIMDRIKELIKVKGNQVAPAELEAHLLNHPSISDCAVIPISDEEGGEVPKAFVVKSTSVSEGNEDDEKLKKDIEKYVERYKARYKWLKGGVEFIDAVPKAPNGKILRRVLRDRERGVRMGRRGRGARL